MRERGREGGREEREREKGEREREKEREREPVNRRCSCPGN